MKVRTSVLAILGLAFASGAMAETNTCTPIVPPVTISTSGIYCLTSNVSTSLASGQTAININADDVVLDMNGHSLSNSTQTGFGIGSGGVRNTVIRNGTVRGFLAGISVSADGYLVEDMLLTENFQFGIVFGGQNAVIRNNRIQKIGTPTSAQAMGMYGNAAKLHVINNDFSDIATNIVAYAILVSQGSNVVVQGNRIDKVSATSAPTNTYGIHLGGSTNVIVRDNMIADAQNGVIFSSSAAGKYMGNMTQGVTTPYTGGTAAGTTNY